MTIHDFHTEMHTVAYRCVCYDGNATNLRGPSWHLTLWMNANSAKLLDDVEMRTPRVQASAGESAQALHVTDHDRTPAGCDQSAPAQ